MKTCCKCGQDKSLDQFNSDKRRGSLLPRCKTCRAADQKRWRMEKPGYEVERYQSLKTETRERHLVRKYGVNLMDYAAMLSAQGGKCAICRASEEDQFKGVFHVDHCHATGKVRGLLCRGCNHMLGVVGDDPEILLRAVKYLVPQVAAEVIAAYMEAT